MLPRRTGNKHELQTQLGGFSFCSLNTDSTARGTASRTRWRNAQDLFRNRSPNSGVLYSTPMLRRVLAISVLVICVACPILEVFDYWDHTTQTGSDTEYTLVLVALCVGASLALIESSASTSAPEAVATQATSSQVSNLSESLSHRIGSALFVVPIPLSPPQLALRI